MALRNTLLVCAAIIATGAIAGIAMRTRAYLPPTDTASYSPDTAASQPAADTSGSYGATQPSDQSQPEAAQQPTYGQQQPYGQGQPSSGPQQQSDQQQQYGQQQQQYGAPQQYGQAAPNNSSSAPYGAQPNGGEMVSLMQMDNADRILPRMPVENANGQRLGEVTQVMMQNGRAREVLLDQGTRIPASDLMFVPARSVLVAQTTRPSGPPQPNSQQGQPYPPDTY